MLVEPIEDRQGTCTWSGSEVQYLEAADPLSCVPILRQFVEQDLDLGKIDREKIAEIRPCQGRIVEIVCA